MFKATLGVYCLTLLGASYIPFLAQEPWLNRGWIHPQVPQFLVTEIMTKVFHCKQQPRIKVFQSSCSFTSFRKAYKVWENLEKSRHL